MRRYSQDRAGQQQQQPPRRYGDNYDDDDDDDDNRRYNNSRYHRDSSSPYPRREYYSWDNNDTPPSARSHHAHSRWSPAQQQQHQQSPSAWDDIAIISTASPSPVRKDKEEKENFSIWDSLPATVVEEEEEESLQPQQEQTQPQTQDPWAAFANNNNNNQDTTTTNYSFLDRKTIQWWTLPTSQLSSLQKDYQQVFTPIDNGSFSGRKRLIDEWTVLGLETSVMSLRTSAIETQQQHQLVTRLSSG